LNSRFGKNLAHICFKCGNPATVNITNFEKLFTAACPDMKNLTPLEIKWAIIFTLFYLLWMVFEKAMGWHDLLIERQAIMTNLFAIPSIAVYYYAILEKRKRQLNNEMTWRQGFICGLMVTLVTAILSPLAQYITFHFISPEYFNNIIKYSVEKLGKSKESMENYFNLKSYIIQGVTGTLAAGILMSAFTALFVKRITPVAQSVK